MEGPRLRFLPLSLCPSFPLSLWLCGSVARPDLAQILFLDGDQFRDAFAVARGAFWSRKPDADDFAHFFRRDHAGAESQDIGVIVFSAVAGGGRVITHGGADAGHLVCGHARPDAGAVDHDAEIARAVSHRPRDGVGEIRVIDGFFGKRPEVAMTVAEFGEKFLEALFHFISAVIRADGDNTTLAGDGAARAIPDFESPLPDQITRRGCDNRVFANDEPDAGLDAFRYAAQIGLGDHVFRRLVYDRPPRTFARRVIADPLSHSFADHRADFFPIHALPPPAAFIQSGSS